MGMTGSVIHIAPLILILRATSVCDDHVPAALPPGKHTGIPCTGGWLGPQAALDVFDMRKSLAPAAPHVSFRKIS
jgi:hypothetical protein